MEQLSTLANIAEILGATTIVGGALFAIFQIREFRAQRRDAVAVELMRSFSAPDLASAFNLVRGLPDGVSAAELRAKGPEVERAAIMICTTFEAIGVLVFRGVTTFRMVQELNGGIAFVMWRKLGRWTHELREENQQPSWGEWFQWLAEQLGREIEDAESNPAHLRHADWRPRH